MPDGKKTLLENEYSLMSSDGFEEGEQSNDDFIAVYEYKEGNQEENKKYLNIKFNQYSEQAWDDKGNKIEDLKVLSKKGAAKMSKDVLTSWKKDLDEEAVDSYIQ